MTSLLQVACHYTMTTVCPPGLILILVIAAKTLLKLYIHTYIVFHHMKFVVQHSLLPGQLVAYCLSIDERSCLPQQSISLLKSTRVMAEFQIKNTQMPTN